MNEENSVDLKDLKITALLEKISRLTAQYENQEADYRVEITVLSRRLREAQELLNATDGNDNVSKTEASDSDSN